MISTAPFCSINSRNYLDNSHGLRPHQSSTLFRLSDKILRRFPICLRHKYRQCFRIPRGSIDIQRANVLKELISQMLRSRHDILCSQKKGNETEIPTKIETQTNDRVL